MRIPKYIPMTFAVGLAIGFFFCRSRGEAYSRRNPFENFVRFYQALGPPSNFYPSVNQLIALCKSRAGKSQVLVVIGGNSTFLGVAQPVDQLWSKRLEDSLGAGYIVVNLAQRGAFPAGAAQSVAEALVKQGYQVIYVANTLPPGWGEPDGGSLYGYMYWNARARGLLIPWDARERYFEADQPNLAKRKELILRATLDKYSNSEDLWNTLCYAKFCTAWDSFTYKDFWKPRKDFKDLEGPAPPAPQRFQRDLDRNVGIIRDLVKDPGGTLEKRGTLERPEAWSDLERLVETAFVPQMRARSLIVVTSYCSYYVRQMQAEEQSRYALRLQQAVDTLRAKGVNSFEAGMEYDDEDYGDLVHMMPSGGARLASQVAPEVRRIARELYGK